MRSSQPGVRGLYPADVIERIYLVELVVELVVDLPDRAVRIKMILLRQQRRRAALYKLKALRLKPAVECNRHRGIVSVVQTLQAAPGTVMRILCIGRDPTERSR